MLGWWRLDESSGNAKDSSGNGYDGTIIGGVTQNVAGKIRTAYQFDGVNGVVRMNQAGLASAINGITALTISFWASALAYENNKCAFSMGDDGTNNMIAIYPYYNAGGKDGFNGIAVWYNGTTIMNPASALLANGTMNHFTYRQTNATTHELFVNKVSVATSATSKTMIGTSDMVVIGGYGDGEEFYTYRSDHNKLWKRALTNTEISTDGSYVD